MSIKSEVRLRGQAMVDAWRTFWFRPELAYTLGVVRIAFAGLLVVWTLWLYQGLYAGFGSDGVVLAPPSRPNVWGVFHVFSSHEAVLAGWFVLLAASIALLVGWHSRLAAIIVFVLILSFERRNPAIFNGGDQLLRIEAIFLALSPCGAALSLDQRRRTGSFWTAQEIRPWTIRLLQIQLSIVYLATVVMKLSGETWQNGTAVTYSLRQNDLQFIPLPASIAENLMVSNVLTWGTLVIEVALGILVWNRRLRPWVLGAGVALHLSISLTIEVGFFTFVTFILYLAFIPPERSQAIAEGVRTRLSALFSRIRRTQHGSDPMATHHQDGARDEGDKSERLTPAISAAQISAALDAIKPLGPSPTRGNVAKARRLANAPERHHRQTTAVANEFDEESAGRRTHQPRHAMQ
jgi:hypothetical protein